MKIILAAGTRAERAVEDSQLSEVERLIGPSAAAMGFRLIRLALDGGASQPTLQIMAEPLDGTEMNVDHCAALSRAISAILDVEDPIPSAYSLEVSSPGVDRPLVSPDDFQRFMGHEARIEAGDAVDGRRRFVGRLSGMSAGEVQISVTDSDDSRKDFSIAFENIARAKLVLTDALIRDTLKKRKS